ncbi:MAG: glycosyltransferase family 39 protein [Deltaproteobacteria bacterium]|nr:glycosyltransferase family 39 protein [Deltaproteobacteria bacterium]
MARKYPPKIRKKESDSNTQRLQQPLFSSKVRAAIAAAEKFMSPYMLMFEIFAVIGLIAAGIFFRMEDIADWKKAESRTFFEGQPLHTTFDAYFYLSLAKDLLDDTYYQTDEKRGVPNCPPRPSPPPLISVMAAFITKLSGWPLSWVGAVLPAVLGALLALPLYLIGKSYSGGVAGFSAALVALLYPFYIFRSGFGRFDTDCLNVTFVATSAYLFYRFAVLTSWKRYIYAAIAVINYGLFLWWWDQTPAVVSAITFLPFAVALVFYYRPAKKEACIFGGIIAGAVLTAMAFKGPAIFIVTIQELFKQFLYISKDASGNFPNIGVTISEQSIPPIATIIDYTTGSPPSFIFACAGIGFLFYRKFKESLFLGSLTILSVLAFTYANRFIIFLVPLLGLGTGYLLGELWKLKNRFLPLLVICPLLLVYCAWPLYQENATNSQLPKLTSATVAGMDAALHKTPKDAVVWAWWDNGYALTYFARRATINDGSIHSGERTYFNALPLAFTNFRLSANFMQFYVARGTSGINQFHKATGRDKNTSMEEIKKILAAGPDDARAIIDELKLKPTPYYKTTDDWLLFFYPSEQRPVYLFLDLLLTRIAYWWYWFGTWDFDKKDGVHPYYQLFTGLEMQDTEISGSKGLNINMLTGAIKAEGKSFQLSQLGIQTNKEFSEKEYSTQSNYCFDYIQPARLGVLMDENIAQTVFHKLYIRRKFDRNYFKPVQVSGMIFQLWEVKSDVLKPGQNK